MKKILAIVLIMLHSNHIMAFVQQDAAVQSKLVSQSLLLDIQNVNDKFLVAVGERGHIIRSTNGQDWQQVTVPTKATLTAVFFVNDKLGWAVGHDATILNSQDGGISWQLQQSLPLLERPLLDVIFTDNNHGIAVGAYGLYYQTSDAGITWQQKFHLSLLTEDDIDYLMELKAEDTQAYLEERASLLPHFNRIYINQQAFYLAGELGLLANSNDQGNSWQRLPEIYQGSFYDITKTAAGRYLAVGLRGNIFTKTAEGTPWQKIEINSKALLNSVVLSDEKVFVLGNSGVLLTSNNGGADFTLQQLADGKGLLAGTVFNGLLIIASEVGIKTVKVID